MKNLLVTLIVLVFAAWLVSLHPRVGLAVYDAVGVIEAKLYGFEKSFVRINEMEMAVYERNTLNTSEAVILLHGYTGSKELWLRFANQLDEHYHVIIPDLAGHGETGYFSGWSYRASAQADRVAQLMETLGLERATIIGNSMGGMIAANFAIMYPLKTNKIIVFNPAGVTAPEPSETERLFAQGDSPFEIDNADEFAEFYELTMAQPPFIPEFVLRGMALRYSERKTEYAHIATDFRFHDLLDNRLELIRAPTLVIWGDQDRILSPSAAPIWQRGIRQSELHIFKGIGHMPMVEVPQQAAQRVTEFLEN